MTNQELEDRLTDFAVLIIRLSAKLPRNRIGFILTDQIVRSGTSAALNYGEARGAQSRKDFIHKSQIVLKELRETFICLKVIQKSMLIKREDDLIDVHSECNELISIFVKSIRTSKGLK